MATDPIEEAFNVTVKECAYLKGDDCQKTRSWLIGFAWSTFRHLTGRPLTTDEETVMIERLGAWVKEEV